MPRFDYVVFTEPVAGKEDAYNDWYTNEHLSDVLKVEGFVAAQRFKLVEVEHNSLPASRYMAIYEIEADDPKDVLDHMVAAATDGTMVISEALDQSCAKTILYQPITARIAKSARHDQDASHAHDL